MRDLAKAEVRRITQEDLVRNLMIAAGVVALTVSFAFYLGTRSGRRRMPPPRA